jgi:hypothetical protein
MMMWIAPVAHALPADRAYELVNPLFKGGYGIEQIKAVASSGQAVAYFSKGAFAGIPSGELPIDYLARRGSSEWRTSPITAPSALLPNLENQDISADLETELQLGTTGPNAAKAFRGTEDEFLLHATSLPDTAATWELAGEKVIEALKKEPFTVEYRGGSDDFCHLMFGTAPVPLLLEARESTALTGLTYDLDRGCNGGESAIRLLGLNNAPGRKLISKTCPVSVGEEEFSARRSGFNAISRHGSEIFFTTGVAVSCNQHQLFVDIGGTRTLEISRPLAEECNKAPRPADEVPCESAPERAAPAFVGASEDGSRVYFTSRAPLVPGDSDGSLNLFMATLGCPSGEGEACVAGGEAGLMHVTSLVRVSTSPEDAGAGEAKLQDVVRVAPDGTRVYFVAQGNMFSAAEEAAAQGEGRPLPQVGADNLYVYQAGSAATGSSAKLAFVADLCSGLERSGGAYDPDCPSGKSDGASEVQSAGANARYLVFGTYAQLVPTDSDNAEDIYRYDATIGSLARVSIGEGGVGSNGNCNDVNSETRCDATIREAHWGETVRQQYELDDRAADESGSRIIFTTEQPLSEQAANGLANVYEWREGPGEGTVSLISSGTGEAVRDAVISSQGDDIFFITSQQLLRQDSDEAPDLYDARVGGGFPVLPVPPEPCEGEACYGPLTQPVPLLVPGSVEQAPGGNFAAPAPKKSKSAAKHKKKLSKMKSKHSKKRKRGKSAARGNSRRHHEKRGKR